MPFVSESSYTGNKWIKGSHLETIIPAIFRKVDINFDREQLELVDGDFLHLDFLRNGHSRILVLFHGLEGSSSSSYIQGMANLFFKDGWDVCCMNFRGRSGEPNRLLRSYHSGATEDVDAVMQYLNSKNYQTLAAGGFSLGGNMLLKYLGEQKYPLPNNLIAAFAFSVPVDLASSSIKMAKPSNRIYMVRFLKSLRKLIKQKSIQFPGSIDLSGIEHIRTFTAFDNRYTGPLHGFVDAENYYATSNSLQFLPHIQTPTLLVNALNDPFLTESCFPTSLAQNHPFLYFESPAHGGHVGFSDHFPNGSYWSETRALNFISSFCS